MASSSTQYHDVLAAKNTQKPRWSDQTEGDHDTMSNTRWGEAHGYQHDDSSGDNGETDHPTYAEEYYAEMELAQAGLIQHK